MNQIRSDKRKRTRKGSIMIFCVVMMTAITTVISATLDLSRIIELRQHQIERETAWKYTEFGLISIAEAQMKSTKQFSQDETRIINGVTARITTISDPLFEGDRSVLATISGQLEGKARSRTARIGKRGPINPFWFALGSESEVQVDGSLAVTGDIYIGGTITATLSRPIFDGNYYTDKPGAPFASSNYRLLINQSTISPSWESSTYVPVATSVLNGNENWNKPLFPNRTQGSEVHIVNGNLEVSGTYVGNATIYVNGNLSIKGIVPKNAAQDRYVFIVDGNVLLDGSNTECFIICKGEIQAATNTPVRRTLRGAFWSQKFQTNTGRFTIVHDEFFWLNPDAAAEYRVPGMWEENGSLNPFLNAGQPD